MNRAFTSSPGTKVEPRLMLGMKDKQKQTNATLGVVHCIFFNVLLANVTVVLALNNVNLFTMLATNGRGKGRSGGPVWLVSLPLRGFTTCKAAFLIIGANISLYSLSTTKTTVQFAYFLYLLYINIPMALQVERVVWNGPNYASPFMVSVIRRPDDCRRCSQRKMPCQVPRQSRPELMGIVSEASVREVFRWAGMSSGPSMVWA